MSVKLHTSLSRGKASSANSTHREKDKKQMKTLCLTILALSASAFAQNNTVVRWRQIVGVITAPGVDSPVGGVPDASGNPTNPIHSGTLPWTTNGGRAFVNLTTGEGAFDVEGLVLNGGSATGTAGPITSVVGTLVCNPGAANQTVVDTPAADLTTSGNAELSFQLMKVPSSCGSPLFLIRIPQFGLRWIAAGAILSTNSMSH